MDQVLIEYPGPIQVARDVNRQVQVLTGQKWTLVRTQVSTLAARQRSLYEGCMGGWSSSSWLLWWV